LAKPVVDGLERRLAGESGESPQAQVLRLNVMDSVGRDLAIRYSVRRVPTLLLLDGDGNVVLRQVGTPRRGEIIETVEQLGE
jgi:thioredoxin-related protein